MGLIICFLGVWILRLFWDEAFDRGELSFENWSSLSTSIWFLISGVFFTTGFVCESSRLNLFGVEVFEDATELAVSKKIVAMVTY